MIANHSFRILLIDDEPAWLESLSEFLTGKGFSNNRICTNPEKAVAAYREDNYEVVITNFMMPGMNGIEILKEIRKINPDAHIIILTGYVDAEKVIEALNNGACAFFRKPVDQRKLLECLNKIRIHIRYIKEEKIWVSQLMAEYNKLKKYLKSFEEIFEKTVPKEKLRQGNLR